MRVRASFASTVAAAILLATGPSASAQEIVPVDDAAAADLAKAIHDQSRAVRIPGSLSNDSTPERAMQLRLDEIAAIAGELEQKIRSGEDREATATTYRRLRAARYQALQLAIHQDVPIDPANALLFRSLMDELKRYYARR